MAQNGALEGLIQALRRLPGVGPRSASRMAYHLLQHDRPGMESLASAVREAAASVRHCQRCHTFTEAELCEVCADAGRDDSLLCVVETPADQAALERTGAYRGRYFVLMGRLSPLDGVGAQAIGLQSLFDRLEDDTLPVVRELILATNFTAEGEATAHVIGQGLAGREWPRISRLARGVPIGSELEYVDLGTIAHALSDRR